MFAVFTAAQLLGKLRNPCSMVSRAALMGCGARHASGARITTRPTRQLNLTKKGTHWPPRARVAVRYQKPNGTRPRGGRVALTVNIFKGQNLCFSHWLFLSCYG